MICLRFCRCIHLCQNMENTTVISWCPRVFIQLHITMTSLLMTIENFIVGQDDIKFICKHWIRRLLVKDMKDFIQHTHSGANLFMCTRVVYMRVCVHTRTYGYSYGLIDMHIYVFVSASACFLSDILTRPQYLSHPSLGWLCVFSLFPPPRPSAAAAAATTFASHVKIVSASP